MSDSTLEKVDEESEVAPEAAPEAALTQEPDETVAAGAEAGPGEGSPASETEPVSSPAPEPGAGKERQRRGGGLLGAAALVIAIIATGFAAYSWKQQASLAARLQAVTEQADASVARIKESVAVVQEDISRAGGLRDDLDSRLTRQADARRELSRRLVETEERLAALQGISNTPRQVWLRAEAEYYLQLANGHLEFASDPDAALAALETADDRLSSLSDPGLSAVRVRLGQEMEALRAAPRLDIQGVAYRIGGLAERVQVMPLRTPWEHGVDGEPQTGEESGIDRAAAAVQGALSGMVSIRRSDEPVTPLLAPGEVYFLRRNVELQLQVARLAVLQRDEANYQESLRQARGWLNEYFDTDDSSVTSALETITELETLEIDPRLPDISGSLALLRGLPAGTSTP